MRFLMALGVALLANGAHALSPLTDVSKVAIGGTHTCALMNDKSVQCWGYNSEGFLGNGTKVDSGFPVPVTGLSDVTAISAGALHTCALLGDGGVRCWGDNYEGSLGDPSVRYTATTPVAVVGLGKAKFISAEGGANCAVVVDGSVSCWGKPYGNGPTVIAGVAGATAVAGNCALLAIGTVSCWDTNPNGQLGIGAPVLVTGLLDVVAISAGSGYRCVLRRSGSVFCWGQNYFGQLGDGTTTYRPSPVRVGNLSDITAVAAGADHACALHASGAVSCWGFGAQSGTNNPNGALGNEIVGSILTPLAVSGVLGATGIAASQSGGFSRTCIVNSAGSVLCWGLGPLGNGVLDPNRRTRTAVGGISDIVAIKAGHDHTCAVGIAGAISCWGDNSSGQLGNGRTNSSGYPVSVMGLPFSVAVAPGHSHTCALTRVGTVWCWGGNRSGQLGIGTLTSSSAPIQVSGLSGVRSLVAADYHTCALLVTGAVQCWGNGQNGELGDGNTVSASIPVPVSGITTARAITAYSSTSCALLAAGTVSCWGHDNYGSLGPGEFPSSMSTTPSTVPGIVGVEAISAGWGHVCTLLRGGRVFCWGYNGAGQRGGSYFDTGNVPVAVSGLSGAIAITTGGAHTCALQDTGKLKCWGWNEDGQLGSGTVNDASAPVDVLGLGEVAALTGGSGHTCALRIDGGVWCWGNNFYGQLGDGRQGFYSTPQTVLKAGPRLTMTEFQYSPLNYYFMTSRDNEKALLDALPAWRRTGLSFPVFGSNEYDTYGISRFYFDQIAKSGTRGSHFYTLLDSENSLLRAQNPNNAATPLKPQDEGVDSFAYLPVVEGVGGSCAYGQLPVYRIFRGNVRFPDDPNHRFTTSLPTYNSAVTQGWSGEGVKFCVAATP